MPCDDNCTNASPPAQIRSEQGPRRAIVELLTARTIAIAEIDSLIDALGEAIVRAQAIAVGESEPGEDRYLVELLEVTLENARNLLDSLRSASGGMS